MVTWNAKRIIVHLKGRPIVIRLNGRDPYKVYEQVINTLQKGRQRENKQAS